MKPADAKPYLKIGDVARLVGVSPSVIRSWESLGLTRPHRTASKYRLYSAEDVKLLKRARFLRKVRGLERSRHRATAQAGRPGAVRPRRRRPAPSARGCASCASDATLPGAGGQGGGHLGGIPERPGTLAHERVGLHAAQAGAILQNQHPGFFRSRGIQHPPGVAGQAQGAGGRARACAWNCWPGATP